jgi:hypothetical protein
MSQQQARGQGAPPTSTGGPDPIILPGAEDQAAAYAALQETRRAAGERLLFPE